MARRRIQDTETPLNREQIVQAALKLLNEAGLKQLSMRKLADSLGIQAASLYWHVRDKEELHHLLADKISSEILWPNPELLWTERLLQWAANFRATLHAYRDSVEIFNSNLAVGDQRLRQIEYLMQLLVNAHFRDEEISWMASMVKSYVLGFVSEEVRLLGLAQTHEGDLEALGEEYRQKYQSLSPDKYPIMIRLAAHTTNTNWEQEFNFGLQVLIDGFSARLKKR
jgi:TetR/AcrR family tetracycline transcriptional repressor